MKESNCQWCGKKVYTVVPVCKSCWDDLSGVNSKVSTRAQAQREEGEVLELHDSEEREERIWQTVKA